jgi:hypothetical protein
LLYKFWFSRRQLASLKVHAQQSVHPTLGILRKSQAVFYALSFFQSDGVPPPAPARVTQTVGTPLAKIIRFDYTKLGLAKHTA